MTRTEITTLTISIVGGLIGTAGLVLSLLNYRRDRGKVEVTLAWDLTASPLSAYDPEKPWGAIRVTNTGRRPVYIMIAAFGYWNGPRPSSNPKACPTGAFAKIVSDSIGGAKIGEGDRPWEILVPQDNLEQHAQYWDKVRAYVEDSAGRTYLSRPVPRRPSWAGGEPWSSDGPQYHKFGA